jgi:hypothetical protein
MAHLYRNEWNQRLGWTAQLGAGATLPVSHSPDSIEALASTVVNEFAKDKFDVSNELMPVPGLR